MISSYQRNTLSAILILLLIAVNGLFIYWGNQIASITFITLLLVFIYSFQYSLTTNSVLKFIVVTTPLAIPIPLAGQDSFKLSFPTEIVSAILFICLFARYFFKSGIKSHILNHPLTILLGIDVFYSLTLCLVSTDPMISFKRSLLKLLYLGIYYIVMTNWISDSKSKHKIFFLYSIGLIIPALYTLYMHAQFDFTVQSAYDACYPFYKDHTIYGACLAFVIPFFIVWILNKTNRSNKYFLAVLMLAALLFIAEIFSYSRAAWISVISAFVLIALTKVRINTTHIIVALVVFGSFLIINGPRILEQLQSTETTQKDVSVIDHFETVTNINNDVSNLERINRWVCALRMFEDKPWFGFGPGTYASQYGPYQSTNYMTRISTLHGNMGNAHSEYLGALAETGIIGLFLLLVITFYCIDIALKNYYSPHTQRKHRTVILGAVGGLITFFVHSLFNSFMDYDKMAILVYGSMAVLVSLDIERKSSIKKATR